MRMDWLPAAKGDVAGAEQFRLRLSSLGVEVV